MIILKSGIKHDTLTALRNAALHLPSPFPDSAIRKDEEIAKYDDRHYSGGSHKNHMHMSSKPAQDTSCKSGPPVR